METNAYYPFDGDGKRFEYFTEKLASILKGWSSLNNNKKMKWFSTYTGLFFSFLMEEFEEEVGGYIDFQFFFSVFFTRTVSGFFNIVVSGIIDLFRFVTFT